MALYDGFFDAEYNAETDVYDREYESSDFTGYFAQVIGSGVCVYNNPDSMRVYMLNADTAMVMPGYLFINGYYLANKAGEDDDPETYMGHEIKLPGTGTYAIAAHLNLGKGMIELEAVSVSTSYPDSLVLAIVNGTAGTAEDTRYNTDICGVIDSAGEISRKVEYAINYIDTQIESKLEAIDKEIDAQAEKFDAKLVEVQSIVDRIVPPPVGTIKFTASQNVDENWLRCDGSFVNESEYPDLVAALGKLTPGVDSVTELLQSTTSEQISNACLHGGTVWVYLAQSQKLVSMTSTERKEITVTGVDTLEVSPSIDIVLSVVDGAVYLAQNNAGQNKFILLECASFTESETSISMVSLDVMSKSTGNLSAYCVPSATKVGNRVYIAYGYTEPLGEPKSTTELTNNQTFRTGTLNYITFTPGDFESAEYKTAFFRTTSSTAHENQNYMYSNRDYLNSFPVFGFQKKNANEMICIQTRCTDRRSSSYNITPTYDSSIVSVTQGVFSNSRYASVKSLPNFEKNTLPVCGNNECLINVSIISKHPVIYYLNYNVNPSIEQKTIDEVTLPSRAKLFKESVAYADAQGIWFVFTGTGLLFSENIEDGNWGYLDTQSLIGYIGSFGCLNYDTATNSLCISGMASDGTPKVARLKLPDLYNYANDGAFLPNIASDGVPAFIKAVDSGSGGNTPAGNYLTITVLEPTNNYVIFSEVAQVVFNDFPLTPGTYKRAISDLSSTFTVGVKRTAVGSSNGGYKKAAIAVNGTILNSVSVTSGGGAGIANVTLTTADYIKNGVTLQGRIINE